MFGHNVGVFYERQRLRMSTWDTPRFLRSYDETVDGGLVLPRGLADTVASLQSLARKDDIESLTSGYGLVVADECHHIPAAGFEHAVKQIPARRWLGLTAMPCGLGGRSPDTRGPPRAGRTVRPCGGDR